MNTGGGEVGPRASLRWSGVRLLAVTASLLLGLAACVSHWTPPAPEGRHRTEVSQGAGAEVGALLCFDCHDSYGEHFVASRGHGDCEACHGPGQLHAHTAKPWDIAYPSNEDCAACHQLGHKTLLGWTTSEHARSGILCSDCHAPHNRELRHVRAPGDLEVAMLRNAGSVTRMCVGCHAEVAAQFDLPSHHPMREGMLECTDCHGAHEDRRVSLGEPTRVCTTCHQEVIGPWIYEHAPVTEDCGHCHAPHGSSTDDLLIANQPAVCISCHTLPAQGAVHNPWALTSSCTDCHSAVHGTYTDPHLRR